MIVISTQFLVDGHGEPIVVVLEESVWKKLIGVDLGQVLCGAAHVVRYGKAGNDLLNGNLAIDVEGRVHGFYRAVIHNDRIGGLILKMGINQMDWLKPRAVCLDGVLEVQVVHGTGAKALRAGTDNIGLDVQQFLTEAGNGADILLPNTTARSVSIT